MVTPRQYELFTFINVFLNKHGYPPTFKEMMEGIKCWSSGHLTVLLNKLEDEGYIAREFKQKRKIMVIKQFNCCPTCGKPK